MAALPALLALPSVGDARRFDLVYGTLGASFNNSAATSSDINQKSDGKGFHMSLGRYLSLRDRVSFGASRFESNSLSELLGPLPTSQSFRAVTVSASVNGYRTFYRRGRVSLFAGAGAGFLGSKIRQEFVYPELGISGASESSHQRFNYTFSLNGSYRLTARLALDAGYQIGRTTGSHSTTQNSMNLSLRLSMASAESLQTQMLKE